jgi:hypothetical protein
MLSNRGAKKSTSEIKGWLHPPIKNLFLFNFHKEQQDKRKTDLANQYIGCYEDGGKSERIL